MDRTAFEAELQRDGYQVVTNTMQPGAINPEHAHDFDARLLVVAGEMPSSSVSGATPTASARPSA